MRLVRDDWHIQIEAVASFLMIFRTHMNILFISKSEDTCAH